MQTANPPDKPRFAPDGPAAYRVTFPNGKTARLYQVANGRDPQDWWWETPEHTGRPTWGADEALAQAWTAVSEAPAPVAIDRAELAAMISGAERGATSAAKLMRRLLKLRTGRAWSVTIGRGTAYSWLHIHAPPSRRVARDGSPDRDGYMSAADRAMLGSILGQCPHTQGEQVRPCAGVRESYMWRLAGHEAPADLHIAAPSWD